MAEKTVNVGGAPMYPSKNIIQNAVNSKDHTTLVAAVKAAGLVETLEGPGPFTVFAPTNAAFAKLPAGTVDNLLKPENKATLVKVLTYHVVPGRMTAANLMKAVKDGEGEAKLKTVAGEDHHGQGCRPRQTQHHRRQGRRRHGDDRRRVAVERRDPRHRYRAAALRWLPRADYRSPSPRPRGEGFPRATHAELTPPCCDLERSRDTNVSGLDAASFVIAPAISATDAMTRFETIILDATASPRRRTDRAAAPLIHPGWVRVTHWINALAMLLMIGSGWQIYDASPLFGFTFPRGFALGNWLGGALQWHFAAMWLLMVNGARLCRAWHRLRPLPPQAFPNLSA